MFRHLLVPTDGSALSDQAVKRAVSFAKEAQARVTFYFAGPDPDSSVYGEAALMRTLDPQLLAGALEERAREVLTRAQATAAADGLASDTLSTVANEPYEGIIAAAEQRNCDLILMASHGRRGVQGLLIGSQTQKVLTHSKIPVLVYR